jgi:hypothetical protein
MNSFPGLTLLRSSGGGMYLGDHQNEQF